MKSNVVIVKRDCYSYPKKEAFRPSKHYPEYLFGESAISNHENPVYDMVREGFYLLGYDAENYGTSKWNPLKHLIKSGDTVLLKPNFVIDTNTKGGLECLVTQPSVIAAVMDYVLIALQNKGKIILGDAPIQECKFDKLMEESGINHLLSFYQSHVSKSVEIKLSDFRAVKSEIKDGIYHYSNNTVTCKTVDLGTDSEFSQYSKEKLENLRITNYDPQILKEHHSLEKHEYCINAEVLSADVIINMPKPKTHRKAGVTIALKNMVGINARKEYLPHHTNGSVSESGDEYLHPNVWKKAKDKLLDKKNHYTQTTEEFAKAKFIGYVIRGCSLMQKITQRDKFYEGSWYGNDTISRTLIDLNKILFYADKNGILQQSQQRKYLIVADMIVSGEKEGPIEPSPKNVGMIAMGENPVCFDETIATIMGAKIEEISTFRHARKIHGKYVLVQDEQKAYILSNDARWANKELNDLGEEGVLYFQPTEGWKAAFNTKEKND